MSRQAEIAQKDQLDRDAIEAVGAAVLQLNDVMLAAMERGIRVELGVVTNGDGRQAEAREWRRPWTKNGFAARFLREEIIAPTIPGPIVTDAQPEVRR